MRSLTCFHVAAQLPKNFPQNRAQRLNIGVLKSAELAKDQSRLDRRQHRFDERPSAVRRPAPPVGNQYFTKAHLRNEEPDSSPPSRGPSPRRSSVLASTVRMPDNFSEPRGGADGEIC